VRLNVLALGSNAVAATEHTFLTETAVRLLPLAKAIDGFLDCRIRFGVFFLVENYFAYSPSILSG